MAFISNKLGIDMSAAFQEAQLQANTIEESILHLDTLHPISFVSSLGKYVQVNLDDATEDRK